MSILNELAWESLVNDLEAWLGAGDYTSLPASLEARPAGPIPPGLIHRLRIVTADLSQVIQDTATRRDQVAQSIAALHSVATRTTPTGSNATPAYLDTLA